jgi:hypothetical protein
MTSKLTKFQKKTYNELVKADPYLFDYQISFNGIDDELVISIIEESGLIRNIVIFDEGLIAVSEIGKEGDKLTFINK